MATVILSQPIEESEKCGHESEHPHGWRDDPLGGNPTFSAKSLTPIFNGQGTSRQRAAAGYEAAASGGSIDFGYNTTSANDITWVSAVVKPGT